MLTPNLVSELPPTRHQPLFALRGERTELEAYLPASVPMNFDRNAEIYAEGEAAGYVYKLISGVVRVSKLLPDGRRQIGAFHLPGDIFGFESDDIHHASAEAIVPVKLVAFKWQSVLSQGASGGLMPELLNRTMIGLRQMQDQLLLLGRKSALERLAAFLLEMARRTGNDRVIDLVMPRHDIADYLGLTLETVSRMFSELKEIGLVRLESARRVHLLDMAKLKAMAA